MFSDDIAHWWKLRNLERSKIRIRKVYARDIAKAKAEKKTREQIEEIERGEMSEAELVVDEIDDCNSRNLVRQANMLDIATPRRSGSSYADDENWTESRITGRHRLTDEARESLRSKIEAARKARRESYTWWVPIVFGLIGALTGLVSLWRRDTPAPVIIRPVPVIVHISMPSQKSKNSN